MIKANNPELKSWIEVPNGSDFPIQNIPLNSNSKIDLVSLKNIYEELNKKN